MKTASSPVPAKTGACGAQQAAEQGGAHFIDLNERIVVPFEKLGPDHVGPLFYTKADHTHTSGAGAMFNAQRVVEGISDLGDCDLKDYLIEVKPQ